MPSCFAADSHIKSEEVTKHTTIDGVLHVALSEARVETIDLEFAGRDTGPVQCVPVDVV